ncbi:STAS domain-containing protein [Paenalkalicoccus suaedae]|uniref:STAS domain-containing protein n=1 Tax=Paenalkalicoccus suaedae TaxID=2592382 RepID=A0A859FF35_9BACI|nr:STAS domain-containing protein [Paenalkalicoccus suaedae]QKS71312.1 STAS domain-containing protein [Paenalkalicoccus suaedae]
MENQGPLPLFKVNTELVIMERSDEAVRLFPHVETLERLVDRESREKFILEMSATNKESQFEINVTTKKKPLELFTVFTKWVDSSCYCLFVPQSKGYERVESQLVALQQRLHETNFELFEKKEELSDLMGRANELSGPYIELSDRVALVPIFGDVSEAKVEAIRYNLLTKAYADQPDRMLIDFTSVGRIANEGVQALKEMVLTLQQMGIEVIILGLHPQHARKLQSHIKELQVEFDRSTKTAIKKWLLHE